MCHKMYVRIVQVVFSSCPSGCDVSLVNHSYVAVISNERALNVYKQGGYDGRPTSSSCGTLTNAAAAEHF